MCDFDLSVLKSCSILSIDFLGIHLTPCSACIAIANTYWRHQVYRWGLLWVRKLCLFVWLFVGYRKELLISQTVKCQSGLCVSLNNNFSLVCIVSFFCLSLFSNNCWSSTHTYTDNQRPHAAHINEEILIYLFLYILGIGNFSELSVYPSIHASGSSEWASETHFKSVQLTFLCALFSFKSKVPTHSVTIFVSEWGMDFLLFSN